MSWPDAFSEITARTVGLAPMTSVRVGGRARFLCAPRTGEETGRLLAALTAAERPYEVLGGGSNVLVPDGDLDRVVVRTAEMDGFQVNGEEVICGAGLSTSTLVALAGEAGLAGVHVLAGIPGQVGGAIAMNAGTRYGEIGETVARVHVRLPNGEAAVLVREDLGFAYRKSRLPAGSIVCEIVLQLRAVDDPRELRRMTGRYKKEKNLVQPTRTWNFGCMFKNPPEGPSAGQLLDRAGLKGLRRGGAVISPLHANFIENVDGAAAEDILGLLATAEQRVFETLGVRLEPEVRVWESSGDAA